MKLIFVDNQEGNKVDITFTDNENKDQCISFPGSLDSYEEYDGCFLRLTEELEQRHQASHGSAKQSIDVQHLNTQSKWGVFANFYEQVLKPSLLSYVKLTSDYKNNVITQVASFFSAGSFVYDCNITFLKLQRLSVFISSCERMGNDISRMSVYSALHELISSCKQYESTIYGRSNSNFMERLLNIQQYLESYCPDLLGFAQEQRSAIKCTNGDHDIWNLKNSEFDSVNIEWPSIGSEISCLEFIRIQKADGRGFSSASKSNGENELSDDARLIIDLYSQQRSLTALEYLELQCCVDLQNSCVTLYQKTTSWSTMVKKSKKINSVKPEDISKLCQSHIDRIVYLRGCLKKPEFCQRLYTLLEKNCPNQIDSHLSDDKKVYAIV